MRMKLAILVACALRVRDIGVAFVWPLCEMTRMARTYVNRAHGVCLAS